MRHDMYIYTEQMGLPIFDRVALIMIGSWYYDSALKSMGAKPSGPTKELWRSNREVNRGKFRQISF